MGAADAVVVVEGMLERRDPASPVYLRVPAALLAAWGTGAAGAEARVAIAGQDLGRRTLRRRDAGTFALELPPLALRKARLGAGDRATVTLRPAEPAAAEPEAAPPEAAPPAPSEPEAAPPEAAEPRTRRARGRRKPNP